MKQVQFNIWSNLLKEGHSDLGLFESEQKRTKKIKRKLLPEWLVLSHFDMKYLWHWILYLHHKGNLAFWLSQSADMWLYQQIVAESVFNVNELSSVELKCWILMRECDYYMFSLWIAYVCKDRWLHQQIAVESFISVYKRLSVHFHLFVTNSEIFHPYNCTSLPGNPDLLRTRFIYTTLY